LIVYQTTKLEATHIVPPLPEFRSFGFWPCLVNYKNSAFLIVDQTKRWNIKCQRLMQRIVVY